jgi:23S rRNA G2069 N7-methylase RlmK/C1962 C5-methylase RlmI
MPRLLHLSRAHNTQPLIRHTPPPKGSQLAFRAVAVKERRLDDDLVARRLARAVELRRRLFGGQDTNGYRLVNGEGDGLPGLVSGAVLTGSVSP